MPGLIRADRNYKGASPSEGKDEEGREGGEKGGKRKKETEREAKVLAQNVVWFFNTCMSVFVNVTERACNTPIFSFNIHLWRGKKRAAQM